MKKVLLLLLVLLTFNLSGFGQIYNVRTISISKVKSEVAKLNKVYSPKIKWSYNKDMSILYAKGKIVDKYSCKECELLGKDISKELGFKYFYCGKNWVIVPVLK